MLLTKFNGIDAVDFIYANGALTEVTPADKDNAAYGINNAGDVVGVYGGKSSGGFLYSGGTLTKFAGGSGPNAATLGFLYGLNDKGQLLGSGREGAVLATPTTADAPEPASFALLSGGLAGLALLARRQRKLLR